MPRRVSITDDITFEGGAAMRWGLGRAAVRWAVVVLALAGGLLLTGTATEGASGTLACASPPAALSSPATALLAERPDLAAALEGISARIEAARVRANVASVSVAVTLDQEVMYARAFGCADVAAGRAATPETPYHVASISKLFTATMLMQLRDAGRLDLDDPIDRYVPEARYRTRDGSTVSPTFRQLASHTAGLPRDMGPPPATPAEFFRRLNDVTATSPPGTRFAYSNLGVALLANVLAVVAEEPFARYMDEHVLGPLGMTSAGFQRTDALAARLAMGYESIALTPDGAVEARAVPPFQPGTLAGAGGLIASALDLSRFAALQFRDGPAGGDQILTGSTLREMWQQSRATNGRARIGVGWFSAPFAGETMIMHNGGIAGYRSDLRLIPSLKLGVAVLVNMSPRAVTGPNSAAGPAAIETMILNTLMPMLRDHATATP
jgi:CubicO group peptidase (beta-lactamase class C family)